jgi:AraC-type DNA-binding domain-containing proteins
MNIKRFYKNRSVIFTWLLSYLLVLIIPVVITSVTYVKTVDIVENEINRSNEILLKRIQHQIDSSLDEIAKLSSEITFNYNINEIFLAKNSIDEIDPYDVYKAIRDLKVYNMSLDQQSLVKDYYVYYHKINFVVSPYSRNDSGFFYYTYFRDSNISYDEWLQLISGKHNGEFISYGLNSSEKNVNNKLAYVQSFPLLNEPDKYANLIIMLDMSRLLEGTKDIGEVNKGNVQFLIKNNLMVSSDGTISTVKDPDGYKFTSNQGTIVTSRTGSEKSVVSYIKSQKMDWKYLIITPERVFWGKVQYIRRLTIISIFLLLAIGGIVVYTAMKKNYSPLTRLIKVVEKYEGKAYDKTNDEFHFINQVFDKVKLEKENADRIIKKQNDVIQKNFISRILKGSEVGHITLEESLMLYGIEFNSDKFAVMAFYIEDISKIFNSSEKKNDYQAYEDYHMSQFIIANIVGELIDTKNKSYIVDLDDMLVCLINIRDENIASFNTDILDIMEKSKEVIGKYFNISFYSTVSSIHEKPEGIPVAYHEAIHAMEYRKVLGLDDIKSFSDIDVIQKGGYYYPLETEQQLINSIRAGDIDKSRAVFETIFKNNFVDNILPVELARCLNFNLISTMIKTISDFNGLKDNDFIEELKPIDRLLKCRNINDMKEEMNELLTVFCEYVNKRINLKNRKIETDFLKNVMDLVDENYMDSNLSSSMLAEELNLHPVYLSKIFKEQYGESLLDYINKIRIHNAKLLIKESSSNLEDIAVNVGFTNTHTFIRLFKKYEGITPGKYKNASN